MECEEGEENQSRDAFTKMRCRIKAFCEFFNSFKLFVYSSEMIFTTLDFSQILLALAANSDL